MYEAIGQTMRLRSGLFIFEKFLLLARNGRDVKVISNRKYAMDSEPRRVLREEWPPQKPLTEVVENRDRANTIARDLI